MVVRERIATARERIAKLREAEKMVGVRGGAERQREQEAAAHAHLKERGTVSFGLRHVEWTLHLLLMKKKNRMSDSLLLWWRGRARWNRGQKCKALLSEEHGVCAAAGARAARI
jgi:hypothetical protein